MRSREQRERRYGDMESLRGSGQRAWQAFCLKWLSAVCRERRVREEAESLEGRPAVLYSNADGN